MIVEYQQLASIRQSLPKGKKVILATGFFDILHLEHLKFLQAAKQTGDLLFVGIETDLRARELKGEDRPIFNQVSRLTLIDNLKPVDYSFLLPENFSLPKSQQVVISALSPLTLAVSANSPHQKEKSSILKKFGSKLAIVYPYSPGSSTSQILKTIKQSS